MARSRSWTGVDGHARDAMDARVTTQHVLASRFAPSHTTLRVERAEMDLLAPVRAFDRFQQRHAPLSIPVAVVRKFNDDGAGNQATLIAYYGFVAIFPLLLLFTTILGSSCRTTRSSRRTSSTRRSASCR